MNGVVQYAPMKKCCPPCAVLFVLPALCASAEVLLTEGTIDMPSYEISAPEKSPVFDCKLSYQRARRSIYPYALNDNLYARKSEVKSWKALFLAVNGTRRGTLAVKVEKKGKTVFEKQVEQVGRKGAL